MQVNEVSSPVERRNNVAKKEEVKRPGVEKREKDRREIVTPRNPASKLEPKKDAATPRSAPPSRGKETPRQKLVSVYVVLLFAHSRYHIHVVSQ